MPKYFSPHTIARTASTETLILERKVEQNLKLKIYWQDNTKKRKEYLPSSHSSFPEC